MEEKYTPKPIDTAQIQLPDELIELTETLGENIHEVWAEKRLAEGWKYGESRSDARKEHPCLIPYEALSEIEKEYDRNTAMETLKVILKLGFMIAKIEK